MKAKPSLTTRTTVLGEAGDLSSPPGSRSWAVAVNIEIQATLNDMNGDTRHLHSMFTLIRDHKGWTQLADSKGKLFASFEAYCCAPQHFGLGYKREDIETIIRERTARSAKDKAENPALTMADHPGRCIDRVPTNTPINGKRNSDYLVAKIARDHPETLEALKSGEFKSVEAAARAAGIKRPRARFYTDNPEDAARAIRKHFQGERLEVLIRALVKKEANQ